MSMIDDVAEALRIIEAAKVVVYTHPDDYLTIREAVDGRPDLKAGVREVSTSQFVEPGQIVVVKGDTGKVPWTRP